MILFGYAADHASRPTYACLPPVFIMRAAAGSCSNQDQQEVTPLPGIDFFDGWRVRLCMKIPTDLPNPGTHPNVMFSAQRPQPLLLNHLKHQTRKDETYLPRLSGTKQRMDPAPDGQQFEPTSTCMPWSSSMDHNSKRYMRLPKNTPRVAKAMTNPQTPSPATRTSHRATTTQVRVTALSVHIA